MSRVRSGAGHNLTCYLTIIAAVSAVGGKFWLDRNVPDVWAAREVASSPIDEYRSALAGARESDPPFLPSLVRRLPFQRCVMGPLDAFETLLGGRPDRKNECPHDDEFDAAALLEFEWSWPKASDDREKHAGAYDAQIPGTLEDLHWLVPAAHAIRAAVRDGRYWIEPPLSRSQEELTVTITGDPAHVQDLAASTEFDRWAGENDVVVKQRGHDLVLARSSEPHDALLATSARSVLAEVPATAAILELFDRTEHAWAPEVALEHAAEPRDESGRAYARIGVFVLAALVLAVLVLHLRGTYEVARIQSELTMTLRRAAGEPHAPRVLLTVLAVVAAVLAMAVLWVTKDWTDPVAGGVLLTTVLLAVFSLRGWRRSTLSPLGQER